MLLFRTNTSITTAANTAYYSCNNYTFNVVIFYASSSAACCFPNVLKLQFYKTDKLHTITGCVFWY